MPVLLTMLVIVRIADRTLHTFTAVKVRHFLRLRRNSSAHVHVVASRRAPRLVLLFVTRDVSCL